MYCCFSWQVHCLPVHPFPPVTDHLGGISNLIRYESRNVLIFCPTMGLYQIHSNPKDFKSLRVEATGKFWVMGLWLAIFQ